MNGWKFLEIMKGYLIGISSPYAALAGICYELKDGKIQDIPTETIKLGDHPPTDYKQVMDYGMWLRWLYIYHWPEMIKEMEIVMGMAAMSAHYANQNFNKQYGSDLVKV